jgi:GH25 family lysozyme M1 (1,4-beta-N-acetylmuramidase)
MRPLIIAAATVLTALAGAAGAGQAVARTWPTVPAGGGDRLSGPSVRANYGTPTYTRYLKAHAAADHMGSSLAGHWSTSVRRAAVPLLSLPGDPVYGDDVSSYQNAVNWRKAMGHGAAFAYIKATEGTYYTNPHFTRQYDGAHNAGMIRGAYVFAIPSYSSGASQADYFASHGGAWSADSHTLPGVLDIEYNPYGQQCYRMSKSAMVSWIGGFVKEYHARTGRWAIIYSTNNWWSACTGNYGGFAGHDPLWIARYARSAGKLPAGWSYYTFWQFADSGTFPGDQDVFNGSLGRLRALANKA